MSLEEQVHHALNGQPPEARARGHLVTKFTIHDFPENPHVSLTAGLGSSKGVFEAPLPDMRVSHSFFWEDLCLPSMFWFFFSFFFSNSYLRWLPEPHDKGWGV